jgi:hypothetical protein
VTDRPPPSRGRGPGGAVGVDDRVDDREAEAGAGGAGAASGAALERVAQRGHVGRGPWRGRCSRPAATSRRGRGRWTATPRRRRRCSVRRCPAGCAAAVPAAPGRRCRAPPRGAGVSAGRRPARSPPRQGGHGGEVDRLAGGAARVWASWRRLVSIVSLRAAAVATVCSAWRYSCSVRVGRERAISAAVRMMVSGVRSSWEALATNSRCPGTRGRAGRAWRRRCRRGCGPRRAVRAGRSGRPWCRATAPRRCR